MTSYKDLLQQREALEAQIKEARQRETSDAISRVRTLIADFGLTAQDVFPSTRGRSGGGGTGGSAAKGTKVAAKYRDPATGATWTGRGKAPKWIQGADRSKYAIG